VERRVLVPRKAPLVLNGPSAVARAAADFLAEASSKRPEIVLGLPTGRTPIPLYDELAVRHSKGAIDLSGARGFNLDELCLPPGDSRSFRLFMEHYAWGRTGLSPARCDIPRGSSHDLALECERYEAAIAASGGLDLAILGLGADGHVAYNMPGSELGHTHVVELPDRLAASLGIPTELRPLRAITMGLRTIRSAAALLVLATGEAKRDAVKALVDGTEDPKWPCTYLAGHPRLEILLDAGAAASLGPPSTRHEKREHR
jgi:glucosamine-6-phosphate deaminase